MFPVHWTLEWSYRGNPLYGEWRLNPTIVHHVWRCSYICLHHTKNTISSFLFPKKIEGKTLGELTHGQAHCYNSFPEQVEGAVAVFDFDCSMMDLTCLLHSPAVDTAFAQGPGVTGVTEQLAETGTWKAEFKWVGSPPEVDWDHSECKSSFCILTLWGCVFERCAAANKISYQCCVRIVLDFLQVLLDKGRAFSSKVFGWNVRLPCWLW